jgi:hypothetical protein
MSSTLLTFSHLRTERHKKTKRSPEPAVSNHYKQKSPSKVCGVFANFHLRFLILLFPLSTSQVTLHQAYIHHTPLLSRPLPFLVTQSISRNGLYPRRHQLPVPPVPGMLRMTSANSSPRHRQPYLLFGVIWSPGYGPSEKRM